MKYTINDQVVLSQPLEGPLAEHIAPFAEWVNGQGYTRRSLHYRVLLAACFSRWLQGRGIRLGGIRTEHTEHFLRFRAQNHRPTRSDVASLRHLIDFLHSQALIPRENDRQEVPSRPVDQCVRAFEQYLREERGLSQATISNYLPYVSEFLTDCFDHGPVALSCLCADDIVQFVLRRAPQLHLKRAKLLTTALRVFFRYVRYRGDNALDLSAAVPSVANWSITGIPRAISQEQSRQLLGGIDRHTAVGRRDYAILLLLARLGLRASEVVRLELDDINWEVGVLCVRGKGGVQTDLPLPTDVGEAIVAYLQHGRPQSGCRRVFLRAKAPLRGFLGASAISSLVRHALDRSGIVTAHKGAHQFRHGLATQMLHQGASLNEIGDVLGHRSLETTKIYAKVDLDALRTLAQPWPGGVR